MIDDTGPHLKGKNNSCYYYYNNNNNSDSQFDHFHFLFNFTLLASKLSIAKNLLFKVYNVRINIGNVRKQILKSGWSVFSCIEKELQSHILQFSIFITVDKRNALILDIIQDMS